VKSSIEPEFSDEHMLIDEYGSEYTFRSMYSCQPNGSSIIRPKNNLEHKTESK